ncbi:MAG TPA: 3'-5' exonuclease, partial [Rugosimonospora sp.]|nr:3'-5' exonuclease [Rugosimonospora sp.]
YAWRGATDQIMRYDAPRLYLTQSFRFGNAVAEEAMKHLPHTETGVTIKGLDSINDMVTEDDMEDPDVVLCRTNAGSMTYAMSYLMAGKRVAMVKGTKQILDVAYAAGDLMAGRKARSLELSAFETWAELVDYATHESGGGHLKAMVKLINVYGISKLIDACNKMTSYNQPHDVAVTTCHSIKGLEWPKVQIGDDFFEPDPFENPLTQELEPGVIDRHEAMIHYVATTRAQKHLDRGGLKWIDKYPAPVGGHALRK